MGKILTLRGENSAAQHCSIKFAYLFSNQISYLVGPRVMMSFCRVSAVALAKTCIFERKIRPIGLNFLFKH